MDGPVMENPTYRRFEMPIGQGAIAAAYYRVDGKRLVFVHTEVPAEFSGQGLATRLAFGAFDLVRHSGRKAVLRCPYLVDFYRDHPEYADIVDG